MANRSQIIDEMNRMKNEGQDTIRRDYLKKLNEYTDNATIIYFSSFSGKIPGIPSNLLSISLEDIQGFMTCINGITGRKLDLILHSLGGSLEALTRSFSIYDPNLIISGQLFHKMRCRQQP